MTCRAAVSRIGAPGRELISKNASSETVRYVLLRFVATVSVCFNVLRSPRESGMTIEGAFVNIGIEDCSITTSPVLYVSAS